ncbi:hypothetical protein FJ444_19305 [Aestuariibacter sp. GS-14]|uniref:hypothetical protein n=1 Tax=Aestuariibacter sp. GS-14 TaxID=2590670 RepID=UPI00112B5061|nr:hypothetical protein [Aestuariibacter sp. GS-14]TPV54334.1 hypothetical protein FJ444_19305 [Aestuariibacter sp. GS-14]
MKAFLLILTLTALAGMPGMSVGAPSGIYGQWSSVNEVLLEAVSVEAEEAIGSEQQGDSPDAVVYRLPSQVHLYVLAILAHDMGLQLASLSAGNAIRAPPVLS